jgi:hypothetical protein
MNNEGMHRNLYVVSPEGELSVEVGFLENDLRMERKAFQDIPVMLENIPSYWEVEGGAPGLPPASSYEFTVKPDGTAEGDIHSFEVAIHEGDDIRDIPVQVLIADAPLVCEAEQADKVTGEVLPVIVNEASGAKVMRFEGHGALSFDCTTGREAKYALWMLARCDADSSVALNLTIDGRMRALSLRVTDGGHDWSDTVHAHTKRFRHYDEQHIHWKWYRIPDVQLSSGEHRLVLSAKGGAHLDALMLLPQTDVMDRAAMNLFQNYNYAPWRNPM